MTSPCSASIPDAKSIQWKGKGGWVVAQPGQFRIPPPAERHCRAAGGVPPASMMGTLGLKGSAPPPPTTAEFAVADTA